MTLTVPDICKVNKPCKNGATCIPTQDGYTCRCMSGYQGKNCDQGRDLRCKSFVTIKTSYTMKRTEMQLILDDRCIFFDFNEEEELQ